MTEIRLWQFVPPVEPLGRKPNDYIPFPSPGDDGFFMTMLNECLDYYEAIGEVVIKVEARDYCVPEDLKEYRGIPVLPVGNLRPTNLVIYKETDENETEQQEQEETTLPAKEESPASVSQELWATVWGNHA